ncbi:YheC/YheD family protein [Alteribacillus bidgolensis]|uniref:YheC/D like ATP-grasp n=1 Tax=Alteribacillus bidgolensis TaxID=930129 RepID=A0A1G8H2B9_9BACI|nr:YheC/YheD family protein [Alteribacillus bidgolensis]SDI00767.1 YheC/D like ATP-grasp [Alteribacillus bidgolensis]
MDVDENKHSGGEEPLNNTITTLQRALRSSNLEDAKKLAVKKETAKNNDHFGVLVSPKNFKALSEQKPHFRTKKLIKINHKDARFKLYFFSVNSIDIQNQLITGIYYDISDGKWKKDIYPYPNFLYRRGGVSKKYKRRYRSFVHQCKKKDTCFLNPSSLGNWEVYNYFNRIGSLKKYLQETILYKEPDDLFNMLEKHRIVYLKGMTGRKAKNVTRIEQTSDQRYRFRYYNASDKKVQTITFKKQEEMLSFISNFYKGKQFMIQKAIDLLEINNRRIDLRAELQRTSTGSISICGISARLGRAKSPVTTHADAINMDGLFKFLKLSPAEEARLVIKMENFLYKVYRETENKYGTFAEMGIDFALDQDLNIKFIECNSQSAKVSLYKAHGDKALEQSLINVLLYAKSIQREKRAKMKKAN